MMRSSYIYKILIISVFFLSVFSKAQLLNLKNEVSFSSKSYSVENLTTSHLQVVYKLTYVHDTKKPDSKRMEYLRLVVGEGYAKFGEYKREVRDSLEEVFSRQKSISGKDFNLYSYYSGQWKKDILKDYKSQKYRLQQFLVNYYEIEDALPKMDWKLSNEAKDISGYSCNKATTNYRGRSYTTWYTKDIPVSDGPYLFYGLPGLILHLEDSEQQFIFSLEGLQKVEKPIYWRNEKRWNKISVKDFYKLEKSKQDNPGFYIRTKAYDEEGRPLSTNFPPIPYNPIERD